MVRFRYCVIPSTTYTIEYDRIRDKIISVPEHNEGESGQHNDNLKGYHLQCKFYSLDEITNKCLTNLLQFYWEYPLQWPQSSWNPIIELSI